MAETWTVSDLLRILSEQDQGDPEWRMAVKTLGARAHARGDGVAVYENADLGHPDLGQWQVVSYGGPESQIESTEPPKTLPDIGGAINWRYQLKAIVPSYQQQERA